MSVACYSCCQGNEVWSLYQKKQKKLPTGLLRQQNNPLLVNDDVIAGSGDASFLEAMFEFYFNFPAMFPNPYHRHIRWGHLEATSRQFVS